MKYAHAQEHGGAELVLMAPHATEKASALNERHVYVFRVNLTAGKRDIANAVRIIYGVKTEAIRIVRNLGKTRTVRGRVGRRPSGKKAYITLPKGTTIDLE